jgi:hypothetical protein
MSALTSTRRDASKGGLLCIRLITKSNICLAPAPRSVGWTDMPRSKRRYFDRRGSASPGSAARNCPSRSDLVAKFCYLQPGNVQLFVPFRHPRIVLITPAEGNCAWLDRRRAAFITSQSGATGAAALTPIFTKRIVPQSGGHTRWQWGRGGSAGRGDRTPSRPSPVITAAPVLTFFSTNYMGTGCVATCGHVRSMAASSARRMRSQRDIPQLCGGPPRGPTQSACTTTLRRRSSGAFPSVSRGRFLAAKIGANPKFLLISL